MAFLIENDFSSYSLNEEEEKEGAMLTITQKQVIQNEISVFAHELLELRFDPDEPNKYIQEESYKRGQLDALRFRLQCSEAAEEENNQPT